MSNTTTLAAPTRRLIAGLILTTIATASAGAWALTAGASDPTDEPTTTAATVEDATVDRPAAAESDWSDATRPIVVADAYHGVGSQSAPPPTDRRRRPLPMASDSRSAETAPTNSCMFHGMSWIGVTGSPAVMKRSCQSSASSVIT